MNKINKIQKSKYYIIIAKAKYWIISWIYEIINLIEILK